MTTWFRCIIEGITTYGEFAPYAILIGMVVMFANKKTGIREFFLDQLFIFYIICVIRLVFFPLPDASQIAAMNGYTGRYIPFAFVADIIRDKTVESVLQVVFNVIMTIPFGAYLTIRFKMNLKEIVAVSFGFSLFIEIGQLTGLFFVYPGSYRFFDVDDLMMNTLGGFIGTVATKYAIKLTEKSAVKAEKIIFQL